MKLCIDCNHYTKDGVMTTCSMGYWEPTESIKTKIFNPIMFECLDFDTDNISPGFGNDIFFEILRYDPRRALSLFILGFLQIYTWYRQHP